MEKETENAYAAPLQQENVMKLDTANFIRTIQEHMDENAETTYNPKVAPNEPVGL